MRKIRIALAQINTVVGDLQGNSEKIIQGIQRAENEQVDILAFPEMTLPGYPPEDLLCRSQFIEDNLACLDQIRKATSGPMVVIVGFVDRKDDSYNAAAILQDQQLVGVYHKNSLPNYGVFDEKRYFQSSQENVVFDLGDVPFGVSICEDIWIPAGPVRDQALRGDALLLINLSASPYHSGKPRQRWNMLSTRANDNVAVVAMVNLIGGQDELIFDGASGIFAPAGDSIALGHLFEEDFIVADLHLEAIFHEHLRDPRRRAEKTAMAARGPIRRISLPLSPRSKVSSYTHGLSKTSLPSREEEIYQALVLGTQDYVNKNGFKKVVLGLSGGVDSALTAVLARDALGPDRVVGVSMPSQFSSEETQNDTRVLASHLGIQLMTIPIQPVFESYRSNLESVLGQHEIGITEENIQSRIRGNFLMALSNEFGWLVLNTGNKSEASVGYCTLYGDMVGGLSIIKDVSKTLVYRLCRYRNAKESQELIPSSILDREPSAELKPNQKDTDSLPDYDQLDQILYAYIEEERSFEEMLDRGWDPKLVREIIARVDQNEYKRRQSPPGLKISPRALGKDRRVPITNRYRIFQQSPK